MFMWMLIEGFYLNLLLMNALFDENRHRIMLWFYIFGWSMHGFHHLVIIINFLFALL